MVNQKIKDVDLKKLKAAKKILAIIEIFGFTEEDLENIPHISQMKYEIENLKNEVHTLKKYIGNKSHNEENGAKKPKDDLRPFAKKIEEYYPNGR